MKKNLALFMMLLAAVAMTGCSSDELGEFNANGDFVVKGNNPPSKTDFLRIVDGYGWLEAETRREGDSVVIILRDAGTPFDPLAKPDPDITLPAEQRQIGGLGIYLCKQLMDSVKYTYENGCNVLTLSKRG
jgi:hypothetical protein